MCAVAKNIQGALPGARHVECDLTGCFSYFSCRHHSLQSLQPKVLIRYHA
jgi:hypothetical protein